MIEPEKSDFTNLAKAISTLESTVKKCCGTMSGGRSSGGGSSRSDSRSDSIDKTSKSLGKLAKEIDEVTDNLKAQEMSSFELISNTKIVNKQMKKLSDISDDNVDAYKKLTTANLAYTKALIEDENYKRKSTEEQTKLFNSLNDSLLAAGIGFTNVNEEFAEGMKKNVEEIINFSSGLLNAADEAERIMSNHSDATGEQMIELRDEFIRLGLDVTDLNNVIGPDGTIKSAEGLNRSLGELIKNSRKGAKIVAEITADDVANSNAKNMAGKRLIEMFERNTGVQMTFAGAVAGAGKALYEYAEVLQKLGVRGAANQFGFLFKNTMKLGISYEALSETFANSRREFMLMGEGGFAQAIKTSKDSLIQFGIGADDAAKMTPDMTKAFQSIGGSVKDGGKLNDYIKEQTRLFADLSQVTDMSIPEIARSTKEFMESHEIQTQLLSVNKKDRAAKAKSIQESVKALTAAGVSLQTAQEMIKKATELGRERLGSRMTKGAAFAQAAGLAGMGAEGMEAMQIIQKGQMATPEEQKRLSQIAARLNTASEQMRASGIASQEAMSIITEPIQDILSQAAKLGMATEADMQIDLSRSAQSLSSIEQTMIESVNYFKALTSLPVIATAVGAIAAGFIAGKIIGGKGKGIGGMAAGAADVAGSLLGGGKGLGGIGKLGMGLAKGGLAGVALAGAQALLPEDSMLGKLVNSKAAMGASIGMMAGPAGALVGGILGGAWDLYEGFSKPKINSDLGQATNTPSQQVNNTSVTQAKSIDDLYNKLNEIHVQLTEINLTDKKQLEIIDIHKNISDELLSVSKDDHRVNRISKRGSVPDKALMAQNGTSPIATGV